MRERLEANGWIYAGKCGSCGTVQFTNPDHPNYVIKAKTQSNIFKLVRNGKDVYGYTNGTFLESKLNELKERVGEAG